MRDISTGADGITWAISNFLAPSGFKLYSSHGIPSPWVAEPGGAVDIAVDPAGIPGSSTAATTSTTGTGAVSP